MKRIGILMMAGILGVGVLAGSAGASALDEDASNAVIGGFVKDCFKMLNLGCSEEQVTEHAETFSSMLETEGITCEVWNEVLENMPGKTPSNGDVCGAFYDLMEKTLLERNEEIKKVLAEARVFYSKFNKEFDNEEHIKCFKLLPNAVCNFF
ncbi:MAG: hypothetical protein LBG13_03125 [Holosporales bacterium]|jgi:hypothetical protein|nr:hypothetical protein [Holosporales bacterium]